MSAISAAKNAIKHLSKLNKIHKTKYISFGIKSGGCSGFEYILKPAAMILRNKLDEIVDLNDVKIKVDKDSLLHTLGTDIDWEDNFMGQRFIFNNPNSDFTCGCGKSFFFNLFFNYPINFFFI